MDVCCLLLGIMVVASVAYPRGDLVDDAFAALACGSGFGAVDDSQVVVETAALVSRYLVGAHLGGCGCRGIGK